MSLDLPSMTELSAKAHADRLFLMPTTLVRAWQGDSEALYQIGFVYYSSVLQDTKDALPWLLHSSKRNNSKADHLIGVIYSEGYGVERDRLMGLKWHVLAARNHHHSYIRIANLFLYGGDDVPQDAFRALQWFYRHDPESRMVKHIKKKYNCYLTEEDKKRPYNELYKDTQSILNIKLGEREKNKVLLEITKNIKGYNKHRKPTKDEVKDMNKCSNVLTKKEMKEVFHPFFFQSKRK